MIENVLRSLHVVMGPEKVVPTENSDVFEIHPRSVEDVSALIKWANRHDVQVCCDSTRLPRKKDCVVLQSSVMNRVLEVDVFSHLVQMQAGVRATELELSLNKLGYTTGYQPGAEGDWSMARLAARRWTHYGGPCYGPLDQLVINMEAVLPNGTIVKTPLAPRRATGADPRAMLLGTHGRFGVITGLSMRIFPLYPRQEYFGFHFPSLELALDGVRLLLRQDVAPSALAAWVLDDALAPPPGSDLPSSGVAVIGCIGMGVPCAESHGRRASRRLKDFGEALNSDALEQLWRDWIARPAGKTVEVSATWAELGQHQARIRGLLSDGLSGICVTQFSRHGGVLRFSLSAAAEFDREALEQLEDEVSAGLRLDSPRISAADRQLKSLLDPRGVLYAG